MKTNTKKIEGCRIELNVTLDATEATKSVKAVENTYLKNARIPGFRQGKAPIDIVRKNFAKEMAFETINHMVSSNYSAAVKEQSLKVVEMVELREPACDVNGGSFTVVLDLEPEFKLPTYKGLKISSKSVEVKDEDVTAQIEKFREYGASYEEAEEGYAVANGDYVQIDYSGTIDGKDILEVAPEAKMVAGAKGFWLRVNEGDFLAEILDALKGMKVGEEKTGIKAKFDKKAAPEPLAGKKALYDIKLLAVRKCVLPDDAQLATKFKAESFEKFTKDIKESLEKQAVENEKARRENEAVEALLKKADFDVPVSFVDKLTDQLLKDFAARLGPNADIEALKKDQGEIMKQARESAMKQARFYYISDAIVAEEKIECKPEERGMKVVELILANAK